MPAVLSTFGLIHLAGSSWLSQNSAGINLCVYTCILLCPSHLRCCLHAQFLARSTWVRTSNSRRQSSSVSVSEPLLLSKSCTLCGVALECECPPPLSTSLLCCRTCYGFMLALSRSSLRTSSVPCHGRALSRELKIRYCAVQSDVRHRLHCDRRPCREHDDHRYRAGAGCHLRQGAGAMPCSDRVDELVALACNWRSATKRWFLLATIASVYIISAFLRSARRTL